MLLLSLLIAGALANEPTIPIEHYELPNGLDVVLAPNASTPIVHVNVWYHVGSKDETKGLTGFAHLFEHLMFNGSVSVPGEFFAPLEAVGASLNGTTNSDRTNYFETVPAEHLPLALFMESDRMGWLLEVLDQGKLDNQREVVRNERRQRYETPPYGEAYGWLSEAAFPVGHPYHHITIGSHEDLEAASLDDVRAFFRKWYVPNNAALVVAGDFDTKVAKSLIGEYFGGIPRGADPVRVDVPAVGFDADKVVRKTDDVPHARVYLQWHSPALFAPGDAELDLIASILGGGKDSRLYQRLVINDKIARNVTVYQSSRGLSSLFHIDAIVANDGTTEQIIAAIDDEIAKLLGDAPPTAEELESARAGYEASFYSRLTTLSGKADTLQSYLMHLGTPDGIGRDFARFR